MQWTSKFKWEGSRGLIRDVNGNHSVPIRWQRLGYSSWNRMPIDYRAWCIRRPCQEEDFSSTLSSLQAGSPSCCLDSCCIPRIHSLWSPPANIRINIYVHSLYPLMLVERLCRDFCNLMKFIFLGMHGRSSQMTVWEIAFVGKLFFSMFLWKFTQKWYTKTIGHFTLSSVFTSYFCGMIFQVEGETVFILLHQKDTPLFSVWWVLWQNYLKKTLDIGLLDSEHWWMSFP